MFSKESGTKTDAAVRKKYQILLQKSTCCPENSEAATVGALQKKTCNFLRKRFQYCEVFKNTYFEKHLGTAASENQFLSDKFTGCKSAFEWQIYRREAIFNFCWPFKPFSILNFAMVKRFCHVICFAKVYLLLFFFLSNMIFLS